MATLKGKGAFQNVNLIVHKPHNAVVEKDGKNVGAFLDVSVDQSLKNPDKIKIGKAEADTNPHLASHTQEHPNGGTYVSHRVFYAQSQLDAMKEAAGKKAATLENGDEVYGVQADVMKNAKGQLIVNTAKDMGPTKNPYFGKTVLDKQEATILAAREYRDTKIEASRTAQVEPEVETEAPEMDQPEV